MVVSDLHESLLSAVNQKSWVFNFETSLFPIHFQGFQKEENEWRITFKKIVWAVSGIGL